MPKSLYTDAEIALIRLGFATALENAELDYYRGCGNSCCPPGTRLSWREAEAQLDLVLYPPEVNNDDVA